MYQPLKSVNGSCRSLNHFSLVCELNCILFVCSRSAYAVVRLSALHALAQGSKAVAELGVCWHQAGPDMVPGLQRALAGLETADSTAAVGGDTPAQHEARSFTANCWWLMRMARSAVTSPVTES